MQPKPTTAAFLIISLALTSNAAAADRQKIRALNVGLHPLFTLASAAVQGKVHGWPDVRRCLRNGTAAGYAFFEAKRLAGDGHVFAGVVVANVASSLTQNTIARRPAFARLGFTLGPTRTEVSTPLDHDGSARFHLQWSLSDTVAMGVMWKKNDRLVWRDGLLEFRKKGTYHGDGRTFTGYTIGVFPGTSYAALPVTRYHESIHAIEAIQANALEPSWCGWRRNCEKRQPRILGPFELESIHLGILPAAGGGALSLQDYRNRWTEIEATRLAENEKPRPPDTP
jgi:hypothetical protein